MASRSSAAQALSDRSDRFTGLFLVSQSGDDADPCLVDVGLRTGVKVLSTSGSRVIRDIALQNIEKWDTRGSLFTLELKKGGGRAGCSDDLVLTGPPLSVSALLDTVVCCCVQ